MIREMQLRNYSERTISSYISSLSKLVTFCQLPAQEITISQLKDYLYYRISVDHVSIPMINQCISAFKILQQDVLQREWEPLKIKRPRREQKLPLVLSTEEVANLIRQTDNCKHKALLALAYSSGVRCQELQYMEPAHIDSKRMLVYVAHGKGKKSRYTLLSEKALKILKVYYKAERPKKYLFEPVGNKGHMYSTSTLNKIAKQAALRAGITKKITFHSLRHTFATHLLEQGINLRLIQQFMGHNSIKTTSRYLHIARINLGEIHSPLDKMNL